MNNVETFNRILKGNYMNTGKLIWSIIGIGIVISSVYLPSMAYAQDSLVMGIFPRRNANTTYKLFKPMQAYLEKKLATKIHLVTSKNFQSFWNGVKNRKFDIVHYNQYHYVVSKKQFGYDVILKNEEFGKDTIAGSIIVRKDSGYNQVEDLRGKTIVFGGGPKAMQSYIIARYLLMQGGLNNGDYIEKFAVNPPNAVLSSYFKQADASGSGAVVMKMGVVTKQIDIEKMKFLARGPQLPHLPWAVKSSLSSQLKKNIQTTLAGLKTHAEGRKVLKKAKLTGLSLATDEEYNPHREIIEAVYHEKYW